MSDNVLWIKTGQRGARAEFSDSDLFTTLLLLYDEPMGRYKLQKELKLTDSSSKSLLNFCKNKFFLITNIGRKGHSLGQQGEKLVKIIKEKIVSFGKFNYEAFKNKQHSYVIYKTKLKKEEIFSWKIRDIAISYGSEAILVLYLDKKGKINFPEKEMSLENFYPDLELEINKIFQTTKEENYIILVISANSFEVARKSAIITALRSQETLYANLKTYL
ncbi:MAG TPA: DUF4443 domain-containing protein [candidate division Zixibacteria bacterium]|nr:DUF4443 domain-containing protein [candidate division Zixibacteria bacterium]